MEARHMENEYKMSRADRLARIMKVYIGITFFCLLFFLIYDRFSHGVHSPWMTWLFMWPLCIGVIPAGVGALVSRNRAEDSLCESVWTHRLWHSGVACITVSSMLRGIFEIAGTASVYQVYLLAAGAVMAVAGGVCCARNHFH